MKEIIRLIEQFGCVKEKFISEYVKYQYTLGGWSLLIALMCIVLVVLIIRSGLHKDYDLEVPASFAIMILIVVALFSLVFGLYKFFIFYTNPEMATLDSLLTTIRR